MRLRRGVESFSKSKLWRITGGLTVAVTIMPIFSCYYKCKSL